MYKTYKAKHILNVHKHCDGGWFWEKYTASPYTGCYHGCEYCYAREEKYNPHKGSQDPESLSFHDPFSEYIKIKENAVDLFRKQLQKKPRDLLCLTSYQPVEKAYHYLRRMLEVCFELDFPVFMNEKSPLLIDDLDILERVSKASYLNVGWSIISATDDKTKDAFEPKTPAFTARFDAIQKLSQKGITTGTIFMPILPFIYDSEENIEAVVRKTKESGGSYVLEGGLTLFGACKNHFYNTLEKYDPQLIGKYDELYANPELLKRQQKQTHELVLKCCKKHEITPYIPRPVEIYPQELQLNKQIAAVFYLKARELQLSGEGGFREWAYRKAAWSLDELKVSVETIIRDKGVDGLLEINAVGKSIANLISEYVNVNN